MWAPTGPVVVAFIVSGSRHVDVHINAAADSLKRLKGLLEHQSQTEGVCPSGRTQLNDPLIALIALLQIIDFWLLSRKLIVHSLHV